MKKQLQTGFTIVELVVVIVVIGILAAVALPRFLGLQDRAHDAVVEGTQAAFASGVVMAQSVWLAEGRDSALDDILEKEELVKTCVGTVTDPICGATITPVGTMTGASLDANDNGYPVSHTQYNTAAIPNQIGNTTGGDADAACVEVFEFLLSESSVRATDDETQIAGTSAADKAATAADSKFDFLAESTGTDQCTYHYLPDVADNAASDATWRDIIYNARTGRVTVANLSSVGTTSQ